MLIKRKELNELVHAALRCNVDYFSIRHLLFYGIPDEFVASLKRYDSPRDQLVGDLNHMNKHLLLRGLEGPPLLIWLINAEGWASPRIEADIFQRHQKRLSRGLAQRGPANQDSQARQPPRLRKLGPMVGAGFLAVGLTIAVWVMRSTTPMEQVVAHASQVAKSVPHPSTLWRPGLVAIAEDTRPTGAPALLVAHSFYLADTEVTRAQYAEVMGRPPGNDDCPDCPVTSVSWLDAARYCKRLSDLEGIPASSQCFTIDRDVVSLPRGTACQGYRLPTEAEWDLADLDSPAGAADQATACQSGHLLGCETGTSRPHPVRSLAPNSHGVFDLRGNAAEWIGDWADPTMRVVRGGSFTTAWSLSPPRAKRDLHTKEHDLGFRIARTLHP